MANPIIEIKNMSKTFSTDDRTVKALDNITTEFQQGEVCVIVGPSGSGKSTLLRTMNGLEEMDDGEIHINGTELQYNNRSLRTIRAELGMVFQQFNLFPHMTVEANLALAQKNARKWSADVIRKNSAALLEKVGIADMKQSYPGELSGGQQQRVAIARALAVQPRVMLFDEPTSSLDPELVGEVLSVMTDLARDGMTMIVVTHQLGFAREVSKRILFMDEGKIIEDSPSQQFFTSPKTERGKQFIESII